MTPDEVTTKKLRDQWLYYWTIRVKERIFDFVEDEDFWFKMYILSRS
jgi:hypothetical protein